MRLNLISILLFSGLIAGVNADVQFQFDYSGSTEFLDPAEGAARRASLEAAAASLGAVFNHTATLDVKVTSSNDSNSTTLASAHSPIHSDLNDPSFFGFVSGVARHKVIHGTDDNGATADIEVDVNFGQPWDLDDSVAPNAFDFKATMIHELLHGLGVSSGIFSDGTDLVGTSPGNAGVWAPFDEFVSDNVGNTLIDSSFAINGTQWNTLSVGGTNGLFFAGPNAVAANGGQPVGLFSPSTWVDGSSGSHLDDENPALAGLLMLSSTSTGQYRRDLSAIEIGIMKDIGYTMKPIASLLPMIAVTHSGGQYSLLLEGAPGSYEIEESMNLTSWTTFAVVNIINGSVSRNFGTSGPRNFYRVKEAQLFEIAPSPAKSVSVPKWRR